MHGFLLIDKPSGPTSTAVTRQVKRISGGGRVGHVGTLDPLASGLLVVALNAATRFIDYLQKRKSYLATIRLGVVSDTYDSQGKVVSLADLPPDWPKRLSGALPEFRGGIKQQAPAHSALKHRGRPLYEYARAGESTPAKVREVEIDGLELRSCMDDGTALLAIDCGPGVYIRSLAHDLGGRIGCGAILAGLRRTSCSGFDVDDALPAPEDIDALAMRLLPLDRPLVHLPPERLDEAEAQCLRNGLRVPREGAAAAVRLYDSDREFMGIGELAGGHLRVRRLVPLRSEAPA